MERERETGAYALKWSAIQDEAHEASTRVGPCLGSQCNKRPDEKRGQNEIGRWQPDTRGWKPLLREQYEHGDGEAGLSHDRGNEHGAKTKRVASHHQINNLPCQCHADEAV